MNKRNTYTAEFKTEVVLEALREEKTINQIAADRGLNPVMVCQWKAEFLKKASLVFGKDTDDAEKQRKEFEAKQDQYEKKIGQLTIEVDWLKKKSGLK